MNKCRLRGGRFHSLLNKISSRFGISIAASMWARALFVRCSVEPSRLSSESMPKKPHEMIELWCLAAHSCTFTFSRTTHGSFNSHDLIYVPEITIFAIDLFGNHQFFFFFHFPILRFNFISDGPAQATRPMVHVRTHRPRFRLILCS